MSTIKTITFKEIVRPFRTTFATSLGRKDRLTSILVRVILRDGSSGTGECPTSFVQKHETVPVIKRILAEVSARLIGSPIDSYEEKTALLRHQYTHYPMTISGLEVALWRAHCRYNGISEHAYFGGKSRTIETDITIPFLTEEMSLMKWMKYIMGKGFTVFKLKVSGNIPEDKKLISTVCTILNKNRGGFSLRLDGNQGYSRITFPRIMDFIMENSYPVELFEQPLPKDDLNGLKEIRKCPAVPVILDETIFTGEDFRRAIEENLCDGVNIKIAKSGLFESQKILAMAKQHAMKVMIGCMTETMVGLSAAIHLAAGTGAFDYIDLDSIYFLHHKNRYNALTIDGPRFIILQKDIFTVRSA
ncbi:MAG: enolase C-terminal domain-like protein [Syntrophorhabdaceae bacterium]|nr:enolase C-terminal domain-like protein [Syntrophorhabdaceae bacterium]